jgi:hypothetical protein
MKKIKNIDGTMCEVVDDGESVHVDMLMCDGVPMSPRDAYIKGRCMAVIDPNQTNCVRNRCTRCCRIQDGRARRRSWRRDYHCSIGRT